MASLAKGHAHARVELTHFAPECVHSAKMHEGYVFNKMVVSLFVASLLVCDRTDLRECLEVMYRTDERNAARILNRFLMRLVHHRRALQKVKAAKLREVARIYNRRLDSTLRGKHVIDVERNTHHIVCCNMAVPPLPADTRHVAVVVYEDADGNYDSMYRDTIEFLVESTVERGSVADRLDWGYQVIRRAIHGDDGP